MNYKFYFLIHKIENENYYNVHIIIKNDQNTL